MAKSFQIYLVAFSVLTHFLLVKTIPLTSVFQYDDNANDDDDDDTEVIEVPSNYLEELNGQPPKDIIDLSHLGEAIFGTPDVETTAQLVANYTADTAGVNPEELGSYLEGDILVPTSDVDAGRAFTKNGVITQSSRWPGGIVPFEIRPGFGARDLGIIQQAMEEYHRRTCIRFVPRSSERDYISITSGSSGCWSSVGRVGGRQEVNLQTPGCMTKVGTPIHELMHALGFLHEQNRSERDQFVSIQYQNIQAHAVSNFEKAARTQAFGVPYDYGSVMHYSANAFSSNGRPTIVATQPGGNAQMGQRNGFSAFDVEKLNKMYECGGQNNGLGGFGGGGAGAGFGVPQGPGGGFGVPQGPGGGFGVPQRPGGGFVPAPAPVPAGGGGGGGGGLIGNFLGGLISGLGLAEEQAGNATETTNEV